MLDGVLNIQAKGFMQRNAEYHGKDGGTVSLKKVKRIKKSVVVMMFKVTGC